MDTLRRVRTGHPACADVTYSAGGGRRNWNGERGWWVRVGTDDQVTGRRSAAGRASARWRGWTWEASATVRPKLWVRRETIRPARLAVCGRNAGDEAETGAAQSAVV